MNNKTARVIDIFEKATERHVKEVDVTSIDLNIWKSIFTPKPHDPELLMVYDITPTEAEQVKKHVAIHFDFDTCIYQMGCFTRSE